jgi:glycerophosphoryl diester phosphodiesterase
MADRHPRVIAHRGASRDCPENTFAAFDEALRQGADGIELDVQLTRDGVPVVYHDKTLVRAGGGRRRVASLDACELAALDTGARFRGETIPTLEAVLDRYARRTRLLIEIKTREGRHGGARHLQLARTVAATIRRKGIDRKVLALSFDAGVLDACAEEAPRLERVLNLKPPPRLTAAIGKRLAAGEAISADVRTLTPSFADGVRRAGRPLYVYTCNTVPRAALARAVGATGVMTDRPGWLVGFFRRGEGGDEA